MIDSSRYAELFRTEAEEHLLRLNRELLRLEEDRSAAGAVEEIFRSLHTLKGMAAAMGHDALASATHGLEGLFQPLLRGGRLPDDACMELAFAGADVLTAGLPGARSADFPRLVEDLLRRLDPVQGGGAEPTGVRSSAADAPATRPSDPSGSIRGGVRGVATVRVRGELLDRILGAAGELVVVSQRLEELGRTVESPEVRSAIRRTAALASALQGEVLASRMVPVATVFDRFPRAVRDHARRAGKTLHLDVTGGEIELDRSILDEIAEPLLHLLRNAVDHGLETPAERVAAGKPPAGTVRLGASRSGPTIELEVADDGRGLDREGIRRAALARGIEAARLDGLSGEDVDRLSTLSGLSTADSVSETSGRGVGLDAVQTAIGRLGGILEIRSQPGSGASFVLRLPLTLAVQRSVVVESGGGRYALPARCVREVTRVDPDGGAPDAVQVRGETVPCRRLAEALGA
ncbi:MAG: Hpt domain-containing protein, partial [Gemmatimonadetes bacterium]|nr:Hpt domain-containing protein [Gemmatimonadota bacterium]